MNKKKLLFWILTVVATALCAFALLACGGDGYSGSHTAPEIKHNKVLPIERNKLTFARGMEINDAEIIEKCNCTFIEDGEEIKITAKLLKTPDASYERFDLETVGSAKQIAVTYKGVTNYIFYDVNEYKVNFYTDEKQTELWQSVAASAALNDTLGLSVWVNIPEYNYSTDDTARADDPDKTSHFKGWYDLPGNSVTGLYPLALPNVGNERILNLHAHYLTDDELSVLDISYDASGGRVFSGYLGEKTETVVVPEGVTDVKLAKVFSDDIQFEKLHIPSTANLNLPAMNAVSTYGLKGISVDNGSLRYSSHNGALYSKDYSTLYLMPADNLDGDFHPSMTEIGSYSCAYWHATSVTIPSTVITLGHYCFAYSAVAEVIGLENVKQIKSGVFYRSGMNVYVDGTSALYDVIESASGTKYMLSMVLDGSMESYALIPNTVSIAGDAFKKCVDLKSIDLGNSLESIGPSAFSGCAGLTSITFPSSLKKMGESVFFECTSLATVNNLSDVTYVASDGKEYAHTLPSRLFYGCKALVSVKLPDGIVDIGNETFRGCSKLAPVDLPSSLTTISYMAFYGCTGITSLTLPAKLQKLGSYAFASTRIASIDLSVCPNLTELSRYCFYNCTKIINVEIPERITKIPGYCFYNCTALKSVKIPSVTDIDENAFDRCTVLTSVEFGDSIKTFGYRAFARTGFSEFTVPDTVTEIGAYAFRGCANLVKITLGKNVQDFGACPFLDDGLTFGAVQPALYECTALQEIAVAEGSKYFTAKDGILYARYIEGNDYGEGGVLFAVPQAYPQTSIVLPSTVKLIIPYSAGFLTVIDSITLNEGLLSIGKAAFYGSALLTSLHIPSTVTNIGAGILTNCTSVTSFTISNDNALFSTDGNLIYNGSVLIMYMGFSSDVEIKGGITEIASAVFMNNAKITSVVIPDSVTAIGDKAFNGCTALTSITIGSGLKDLSESAFSSIINLITISVSADNPYFKTKDDVLYTKDGKTLLLAAPQNGMTEVQIENGVVDIADYAFARHATLSGVKLPDSVKTIGEYAFWECKNLAYFFAGKSLETIGQRAFSFDTSGQSGTTETRYGNTLKRVLLYDKMKRIDDQAFYGQYGIVYAYFRMTKEQLETLVSKSGVNVTYLTYGCPNLAEGDYHNRVIRCLYSEDVPTFSYDEYSWFGFDENGDPRIYKNINDRGVL